MQQLSPFDFKAYLSLPDCEVWDVRTAEEYASGHIPGVRHVPLADVAHTIPSKGTIACYCFSGRRSALACQALSTSYPHLTVVNLEGGIKAWASLQLPVDISA